MLEVFDNDSIHRILRVRRRDCVPSKELRRRLSLTRIPALLVKRRLRLLGELIKVVVQTSWRPAEDMGYRDQGGPGTDLRTASLRLRTMETGLGEIQLESQVYTAVTI